MNDETNATVRTYDWGGNTDLPISGQTLSDVEVASLVRMLMRDQLNHEFVCMLARDRIMALVKEKAELEDLLALADETICETHGCFPLDRVTAKQRRLNDAMRAIRMRTGKDFERIREAAARALRRIPGPGT